MSDPDITSLGRHQLEAYTRAFWASRAEKARMEIIYSAAIRKFGGEPQMRMAQEECAELVAAINHSLRGRVDVKALASEVADVEIMCGQMRLLVGHGAVERAKREKLERLEDRVNGVPNV